MRTVLVQSKSLFVSKTFWINTIVGLLAILGELQDLLPSFADILVLPESATRWLLLTAAIGNIILRRISDQPVRVKTEESVALPAPGTSSKF